MMLYARQQLDKAATAAAEAEETMECTLARGGYISLYLAAPPLDLCIPAPIFELIRSRAQAS